MNFMQTVPGEDPVIVEGFFPTSPEVMFAAWTQPGKIKKWFGYKANSLASAHIELREGGAWRFLTTDEGEHTVGMEGVYLEIIENERLVFTWTHVVTQSGGKREETPTSQVEVNFSSKGNGTLVHLIHSGIRTEDARKGVGGGWNNAFGHIMEHVTNSVA